MFQLHLFRIARAKKAYKLIVLYKLWSNMLQLRSIQFKQIQEYIYISQLLQIWI